MASVPLNKSCNTEYKSTAAIKYIATCIQSGNIHNIITLCGAGISTAAGIPDFRTPSTGLYAHIKCLYPGMRKPELLFDIRHFKRDPTRFYRIIKQLFSQSDYKPTKTHKFIKLLADHGLLLRDYTQNIDGLQEMLDMSKELVVNSHGSFSTAHCIKCGSNFSIVEVKACIQRECVPRCTLCQGAVKPDITFYGEQLPPRFYEMSKLDFPKCDLLIVLGTSISVLPFDTLLSLVPLAVPCLFINLEKCSTFNIEGNSTHRMFLGTTDTGCQALADELGWGQ